MQAALESVDGVESVEIDFAAKTATVMACPSADKAAMCEALKEAGFGATVKN